MTLFYTTKEPAPRACSRIPLVNPLTSIQSIGRFAFFQTRYGRIQGSKKKRWFVITKNRHALKEPLRDSSASIYYQVIVTAFITQRLLLFVFVPKWKKNKWYIYYLVSCFGPVTLVSHAPAADEQDYLHTHTHTHTPATPCWTCSVSIHYEQSQVVSTQCLLLFFMVSCTAYSHLCECAPCIIVNIKYTKLVFI